MTKQPGPIGRVPLFVNLSRAAELKGCTTNAVAYAADVGDLAVRDDVLEGSGGTPIRVVDLDELERWTPRSKLRAKGNPAPLATRLLYYLERRRTPATRKEIVAAVGARPESVSVALTRLRKEGRVVKVAPARWVVARTGG